MLNLEVKFQIDYSIAEAKLIRLREALAGVLPPQLQIAFQRAGVIYLGAMRQRFFSAARGDGTWPPLALATMLARLRGKGLRNARAQLKTAKGVAEQNAAMKKVLAERHKLRLASLR